MGGHHEDVAITGATGRIGGLVSRNLADRGVPHRLLVRDPARAPRIPGTTVFRSSYELSDESIASLRGVTTLFMVSAAEHPDRRAQHRAFVDAAAAAGVQHVVYLSFYGAAPDATFTLARDHFDTEQHLRASGMTTTFLRDNLYLDFMSLLVGDDGAIRGPAGSGLVAGVAQHDVAHVAAAVLTEPAAHCDVTYNLTGPAAFTLAEAAEIISVHQGRLVRFVDETLDQAWDSRRSYGAPDWQVQAWISTYTAIAAGELAGVTGDVERLTGRVPMTLADVLGR